MEEKNIIVMRSLTQAHRGKDMLMKKGIRAQIIRTPGGAKSGGCGYSLYVPEGTRRAKAILRSGGVI